MATAVGRPPESQALRFGTWNIRNGRNSGLETALRAMAQMNLDLGVLTETKVTNGIYTRLSSGFRVVATDAASPHQGGVALFFKESEFFSVESIRRWGPNVISFVLRTGNQRFGCVGGYIPPNDSTTIESVTDALEYLPDGIPTILLGDLNANLAHPRDAREAKIAACAATFGLKDMLPEFRQRSCRHGHGTTWRQHRTDIGLVTSRCDYLLSSDRRFIRNVQIRQPRLHTSDHLLVLGVVQSAPLHENRAYVKGRKCTTLKVR